MNYVRRPNKGSAVVTQYRYFLHQALSYAREKKLKNMTENRRMKYRIIAILPFFLIMNFGISCRKQQKEIQAAHIVEISDDDLKNTASRASEIFDSVEFVFLETNDDCLMGRVSKVLVTKDHFILKSAKAVFIFDREGTFVRRIYHVGRGHGEYIGLDYITFLSDGTLLLLDSEHKKMLGYSTSDSLLFDVKLPFFPGAAEELNEDELLFVTSGKDDHLIVWNQQKEAIKHRFMPFDIRYSCTIDRPLLVDNGTVCFTQDYRPGLFKVDKDGIRWQWYIDAGERTIQEGDMQPVNFFGATVYAPKPGKSSVSDFLLSEDILFFRCQWNIEDPLPYDFFYSRKSGSKLIYKNNSFVDDLSFYSYYHDLISVTPSGEFVCVYDAADWLSQIDGFSSKVKELGLEDAYNALLPKLSGLKPDDNPVLALFRIKDF